MVHFFFHFSGHCVAVKSSWCVHRCSFHQFYWVSDRCRSGFELWWFLSESDLSCCHKLLVSTSFFWSWLLNDLQFSHLWNTQRGFFGLLMRCGYAGGPWEFWVSILVFMFMKNVFFVFILDAIFCATNFFISQDSLWLVKKSWCVHCFYIHQFYWVNDRCRIGFALLWFPVRKSCHHKLVISTSFCYWLLNFLQFWHLWIKQRQFLGF